MAKKKKSKVVEVQADGTEIHGFEPDAQDQASEKVERELPQGEIQNHSKFDKFKQGAK